MGHRIYEFSILFSYSLDLILLICCLIYCYRDSNLKFIKVFPVFIFVTIIADILMIPTNFFPNGESEIFMWVGGAIYFLFMGFTLIFFSYLLSQLVQSTLAKKFSWSFNFLAIFPLYLLIPFIHKNNMVVFIFLMASFIFQYASILTLCFIFFRELLASLPLEKVKTQQPFWCVVGILFLFTLQVPTQLFSIYFSIQKMPQMSYAISSVYFFSTIIPYALFIKAITCKPEQ